MTADPRQAALQEAANNRLAARALRWRVEAVTNIIDKMQKSRGDYHHVNYHHAIAAFREEINACFRVAKRLDGMQSAPAPEGVVNNPWEGICYELSVFPYEAGTIQLWHKAWKRGVSVGFYDQEKQGWFLHEPDGSVTGVGIEPSHWCTLAESPRAAIARATQPDAVPSDGSVG